MKKFQPSVLPAFLWLIITSVLLLLPGSSFPKDDWLGKLWFDKWVHVGLFAIMVILWNWSFTGKGRNHSVLNKIFVAIALLALAYGIGMEFAQKYFVVNRSFDAGDILADAGGCFVGWLVSTRYLKK